MSNQTCVNNFDCAPYSTNRLCYPFQGDNPYLFKDSQGCACNNFWGWQGAECDELGITSYLNLVIASICGFLSLITVVINCKLIWKERYMQRGFSNRSLVGQQKKPRRKSAYKIVKSDRGLTLCLILLSGIFLILWCTCRFLSTFIREGPPLFNITVDLDPLTRTDYGSFGRFNVLQEYLAIPASLAFGFLGIVNVALIWIEIARSSRQLSIASDDATHLRNRRILRVIQVLSILLIAAANITDRVLTDVFSIVGFILLPLCLGVVALYYLGHRNLTRLLTDSTGATTFRAVVANIRITTILCSISMIGFSASWFGLSLIDNLFINKDISGIIPVDVVGILENGIVSFVALGVIAVTRFLKTSGDRNKKKRTHTSLSSKQKTQKATAITGYSLEDSDEQLESITKSTSNPGPPIAGQRRIKSPRDKRQLVNAGGVTASTQQTILEEDVKLPGEESDDDEEDYVPKPYDNVKTQESAGPPIGRTRRIKSPRLKREEAAEREASTMERTENELFEEED